MEYEIKQLTQNSKIFFPQTSAESVLVKDGAKVITLDKALSQIIITSENSGLDKAENGVKTVIFHKDTITPNILPLLLKVRFNSTGHIVETTSAAKILININNQKLSEYDGNADVSVNFSDSFKTEDDKIEINWNEINNGAS